MNRRRAIQLIVAASVASATAVTGYGKRTTQSFFIAGVRYQRITRQPKVGDRVYLEPGLWQGTKSLAIVTGEGIPLGFVPRSLVATIAPGPARSLVLSRVEIDSVPWKRYQVKASTRA